MNGWSDGAGAGNRHATRCGPRRFWFAAVAVTSATLGLGAGIGSTGDAPQSRKALEVRSDALNRAYGLGEHAHRRSLGAPGPGWLRALRVRSAAMNRFYGLGRYARRLS